MCCAWHVARGWGSRALLVLVVRRFSQRNIVLCQCPCLPNRLASTLAACSVFFDYFVYWGRRDILRGELMTL